MSDRGIEVPLQPKQSLLLDIVENSQATWIGYGGSRGGAKSHAERAVMLLRRLTYPNTRGVIFRRTYEKVRENHIEPMFRQYPFMREWYNVQNKEINLPNGSAILFRYAENPGDVDDYIGKEYMDFFVDQAETLTERELLTLKSCTRWPGMPDHKCKFMLGFNPGNVGHKFLKRIFFDKDYRQNERAEDYSFVQAYGWDNVEWAREALRQANMSDRDYYSWPEEKRFEYFITNTQYGRELNALPEALRIGWLLGRMDRFAGQYFDVDQIMYVRKPQEVELKPWHPRWLSIDWGYAHPAAVYWHARLDDGRVFTYRELVTGKDSGQQLTEPELGRKIVELSREDAAEGAKIRRVFLSHDGFAVRGSARTIAEQISEELRYGGLPSCDMADKDRIGGARLCYNLLRNGFAMISTECPKLIECLPSLTHEDGNEEDVLKVDGDDTYDSWRYGLKSELAPGNKPFNVRVVERVAELVPADSEGHRDLNAVAMASRKAQEEIRKKFLPVPVHARKRRYGGGFHGIQNIS